MIHLITTHSTRISEIAYCKTCKRLNITFRDGETWAYKGVPFYKFEELDEWKARELSIGTYYFNHIKDQYDSHELVDSFDRRAIEFCKCNSGLKNAYINPNEQKEYQQKTEEVFGKLFGHGNAGGIIKNIEDEIKPAFMYKGEFYATKEEILKEADLAKTWRAVEILVNANSFGLDQRIQTINFIVNHREKLKEIL